MNNPLLIKKKMPIKTANVVDEYKKDPKLKKEDVQNLMEWANFQPHLPKLSELQTILFLQSCYFSNEAAKTAIDTYFTVKTLCPEIFLNRNPINSPLKEAIDTSLFAVLPKKTPEGYTILFIKFMNSNPDVYNFSLALRAFDMSTILYLNQYGTSNGHIIVIDMDGVVFGHLTKLGPLIMKKFLYYLQEGMPVRLKGLHYFNVVSFMDKILALMKPFMKKELMDVLHLHNTVDDLTKFIPRDCLPQEYGGSCENTKILHEKVKENMMDNVEFYQNEDKQKVDETKRPGKPKNITEVFGVEGTFKKLDID